MSEERIKERCKREDIALKIVKGFLEKDCYTDTELEYSLNTLLDLYNKQKEEIKELNKEFALNTEIHKRDEEIKELKETIKCLHEPAENYISKDKIKDKIKELDSIKHAESIERVEEDIELLKELLEE